MVSGRKGSRLENTGLFSSFSLLVTQPNYSLTWGPAQGSVGGWGDVLRYGATDPTYPRCFVFVVAREVGTLHVLQLCLRHNKSDKWP